MSKINLKNIKSYIQGNLRYHFKTILPLPDHLKEQYYYRLYKCKDDCLKSSKQLCEGCGCPVIKKAFASESCNLERFPNFLSGSKWREYKEQNNINNIEEIIKEIEKWTESK